MTSPLIAVVLGIIEGLTEFLPVSSTGHLIIAGHVFGFTGPKADTFEIVIQLGAILAVLVLYRRTFWSLVRPTRERFSGFYGVLLLGLTTLPPAVLGLIAHSYIKEYLFSPVTVAVALIVGALGILAVEFSGIRPKVFHRNALHPLTALGIGCFQCLALWPGFSRSAATIMGGIVLGVERKVATEYSFLAAVPLMCAATGYDLLKNWQLFSGDDVTVLGIGFGVSFIAALLAIRGFIHVVSRFTLQPFAWYRLALAPVVLWFFW
ncbi:undecaprenyl-diphosphate phosphatase [Desulfovibrionales bacterium]